MAVVHPLRILLLTLLCVLSVITDLKSRKIPNKITMPFALAGFLLHIYEQGFLGAKISLMGFLLGFFVFLIPYAMRVMGAGDVKLMAALGAITSWKFVMYATLLTAIAGGVIVLLVRAKSGGIGKLFRDVGSIIIYGLLWPFSKFFPSENLLNFRDRFSVEISHQQSNYIPYAVAIAIGNILCLVLVWTGRLSLGEE